MYFATMWSYLSGLRRDRLHRRAGALPVFGVLPVQAFSVDFFARLIPFLVVNQLLFLVIGHGHATWRGQQYSLALFPLWIKAFTTAFDNVFFGRAAGLRR